MGTGYKSEIRHFNSIGDNLGKIANKYQYFNGYFGSKGDSSIKETRHIESDDPIITSKDFYSRLAYGGIEEPLSNGKGAITKMKDGSVITYRRISSSDGTPAVDINIRKSSDSSGVKQQKIHFVKKGNKHEQHK